MKKILYICFCLLLLTGCSVKPIGDMGNDAERFSEEYSSIGISKDNPIIYKTDREIIDILKSGTGIIYFGFPDCPWCQSAIPVLLKAAKEMDIDKIYYFDPKEIREENTDTYQEIVKLLGDNLNSDENGNKRLYVPDVYFVSGGKIIGHHFKTVDTQINPKSNPLTNDEKTELKKIYKQLISKTYNIECDC
jgi:thiol-disulfide isomerase/thioredoxin